MFISEAVCYRLSALCCQQLVHQSRACRCVQTISRPWMRAHPPEPGKAHGQVVNKWKWKIATTCWTRSSTCRQERWSGHDGCPVSPLLLIWSKNTLPLPHLIHHRNRQPDVCRWPTTTENCLCAKLPLEWNILFICCMSPIMFLSPSRLLVVFIKMTTILACFSVKQPNRDMCFRTCSLLPKRASRN